MKNKNQPLWKVSLIVLVLAALYLAAAPNAQAVNQVTVLGFGPPSPNYMLFNERVYINFTYTTDEANGCRIHVLPYTKGNPTPNYAVSGSPVYPPPKGGDDGQYITVTSGEVVVDQIRVQMKSLIGTVLFTRFYDVIYRFGNSVHNVELNPASPAQLAVDQHVDVTFDYVCNEPAHIFTRPKTNGVFTNGYAHSGSPVGGYSGKGSGSSWFMVTQPNRWIDEVNIQMWNLAQTVLLKEYNIPVSYHVCDGVNPCVWYVDHDGPGLNNGTSWYNAFHSLQDALAVAWPGEQIWVAEGTYKPDFANGSSSGNREDSFNLKTGVGVYGGFNGTESSLEQRDWHANETILSGNIGLSGSGDNSYHVVSSSGNDENTVLDGFTITAGNCDGSPNNNFNFGGGLFIWTGSPVITNCMFIGNSGDNGAGMCGLQPGAPLVLNCKFIANVATGTGGACNIQNSSPVFLSCFFAGNKAGDGGAVMSRNNRLTPPVYTNCVFSGNIANGNGGAMYQIGTVGDHIPPVITNCSFHENTASNIGGGIYNYTGFNVSLNSVILWNNSDSGGTDESAQFTVSSDSPEISYSCLMGWTGGYGGIGNIGDNPLFVDPDGLDDSLGNEDDNLRLQVTSPCIDTGDPNPAMNDSDGSRNDMGAYGGPGAEVGGIGVIPGSGFLFTNVGNIPRSEITLDNLDPDLIQGCANVYTAGLDIPNYVNTAFRGDLRIHGLFGADDTWVTHYQVLVNGAPVNKRLNKVFNTWNPVLLQWESEVVKIGPHDIGGVEDVYIHTASGFWSLLDLKAILPTSQYADGLYHLTIRAYEETLPGVLVDRTGDLGPVGELWLRIENTNSVPIIHSLHYDPTNPYYTPHNDGEIEECSIINLVELDEDEPITYQQNNLRFKITASHPDGYLRLWILDCIYGKNNNGGVIARQTYPGTPPPLWSGVTNQEFQSINAPNPPGNLLPWTRCAYQFRLRTWRNTTNGYGYPGSREFSDHYFLDLPGSLGCSIYDRDKNGVIDLVDYAYFSQYWLQSCLVE